MESEGEGVESGEGGGGLRAGFLMGSGSQDLPEGGRAGSEGEEGVCGQGGR